MKSLLVLSALAFGANAYAESNRGEVRGALESKWQHVAWGREISEMDYALCAASLAVGGDYCWGVLEDAALELGIDVVKEAFRNPGHIMKINGRDVRAGFASYNNYWWTEGVCPTWRNPLRGCKWKTDGANTHQPYIAWGVAPKDVPTVSYGSFALQTGTVLSETDANWQFLMASNDDLIGISKSNTGTHSTEVHVLSAASGYRSFSLQTGTALHETGDSFEFLLAPNRDLFAISKNRTGSGTTEIHVLSAASNYQTFTVHTGTALHQTGDDFQFLLAPNRDLVAIKKSATGTGTTEVHVLSAASNYQEFSLQTPTALHETGAGFSFLMAPNRDILAISRVNTGTDSTEVHILSAAAGYASFSVQTGTALPTSKDDFEFVLAANGDVVAVKKQHTGTGSSEIHRLKR